MIVRISKAVLTLFLGLFGLLVGIDNILDYGTNFEFVRHVLSMDTTFPHNALLWRAITSDSIHHVAYALLIASEIGVGVLCIAGAWRLFARRFATPAEFNAAKSLAIAGLAAGFGLYFFGFLVVGGEWFQMWQSPTWNGQEAAFRFAASFGIVLIFVALEDAPHGHDHRQ
jgi:predicted small integral membrane protein